MTVNNPQKILLFSRDPGGTNQLVAVRDLLLSANRQDRQIFAPLGLSAAIPAIRIVAKDYARDIWKRLDADYHDWAEVGLGRLFEDFVPDLVLTATGHVDDYSEQEVWRQARSQDIPSAAFLDSADHVQDRFLDATGGKIFPDHVYVFDRQSAADLSGMDFPAGHIHITGDLYAGYLGRQDNPEAVRDIRSAWNSQPGESIILFASDYISEIGLAGFEDKVSEFECLDYLIDGLEELAAASGLSGPFRLVIRMHPKDTPGKYDAYPDKSQLGLTIMINNQGLSQDAVRAADLVAGMRSALLREADVFGTPVLRLIPLVLNKGPQKSA